MKERYQVADLIYYIGLMAGTGATYVAIEDHVSQQLVRLLIAIAVGVGAGWTFERFYRATQR